MTTVTEDKQVAFDDTPVVINESIEKPPKRKDKHRNRLAPVTIRRRRVFDNDSTSRHVVSGTGARDMLLIGRSLRMSDDSIKGFQIALDNNLHQLIKDVVLITHSRKARTISIRDVDYILSKRNRRLLLQEQPLVERTVNYLRPTIRRRKRYAKKPTVVEDDASSQLDDSKTVAAAETSSHIDDSKTVTVTADNNSQIVDDTKSTTADTVGDNYDGRISFTTATTSVRDTSGTRPSKKRGNTTSLYGSNNNIALSIK